MRVEISGRNSFWENAVKVEWASQFPERSLTEIGHKTFRIEADWLEDLQRVAQQCFSTAIVAPEDLGKRNLFRQLFKRDNEDAA